MVLDIINMRPQTYLLEKKWYEMQIYISLFSYKSLYDNGLVRK